MRRETTTFENDDAQRDPSKSFDSWIGAYTGRYSTRVYNQQSTTNNRQHQHVVHVQDQRVGGVGSGCHLKVVGHPTLQVKVGRFPAVHVVRVLGRGLGRGLVMVGVVGVVGGFQTDGDQHDNRLPDDGPWRVGTCGKRKQKSVVGWLCEVERIVSAAIIPHQKNTTAAASLAVSSQYHHWQHHCGSINVATSLWQWVAISHRRGNPPCSWPAPPLRRSTCSPSCTSAGENGPGPCWWWHLDRWPWRRRRTTSFGQ